MHYEIVINRDSGSGLFRDGEMRDRLRRVFTDCGHTANMSAVAPESLQDALKEKSLTQADAIIIGGGDGTIATAATLMKGSRMALGVLPLGTFNLEARDLGIDLDPFSAAAQLTEAVPESIDLMLVNDHVCLCAAVIGFYPTLASSREEMHGKSWWLKSLRMVREIATVAIRCPPLDLELNDGREIIRRRSRLAAFSPGKYQDSIGLIPDRGDLSSGKLSAYVSSHLSRMGMLQAALGYVTGSLFDTEGMDIIEGTGIVIDVRGKDSTPVMIDGEFLKLDLPAKLSILPDALRVLRPRKTEP